ncbi:hypothetical protein SAMN05421505_14721 [Sinosporangium album]|uniref:Neocarzinostatin family protein n=1 Tax=Sinosporangium album TaxID=504805 RepID=A0A1G8K3W5_9ACTN|nr:hypothetical protein [Sinosporangium album]SDI38124.1 hypothetical protein SAMN05421505_14721 [Sinosporangium album]
MNGKAVATKVGAGLAGVVLALSVGGASAAGQVGPGVGAVATEAPAAKLPPKGARAVVQVSPNPTARRGEEVTITGRCGGGQGLKAVISGFGKVQVLKDIRIIKDDPDGFLAKAKLSERIGNGVGPVFVDCGGEAGVTLLVTHV